MAKVAMISLVLWPTKNLVSEPTYEDKIVLKPKFDRLV